MNTQDFLYITKRVFRKMAIPLSLFFVLCGFVFVCFLSNQTAYANLNVANIKRTVNLINNSSTTLLFEDEENLSDIQSSSLNLNDIDVVFDKNSKLEYIRR